MKKKLLSTVFVTTLLFLSACNSTATSTTKTNNESDKTTAATTTSESESTTEATTTTAETTRVFSKINVSYVDIEKALCASVPSSFKAGGVGPFSWNDEMVPLGEEYEGAYPYYSFYLENGDAGSSISFVIIEFKPDSETYKKLTEGKKLKIQVTSVDGKPIENDFTASAINGQFVLFMVEEDHKYEEVDGIRMPKIVYSSDTAPYKTEAGAAIYTAFMALK